MNCSDDPHHAAASVALQNVNHKHALHQLSPPSSLPGRAIVARMSRRVSIALLFFCLILPTLVSESDAQQTAPGDNVALNKKACDYLSKTEAESLLGATMEANTQSPFECRFLNVGFTNRPPNNKQVDFNVWFWSTPQPKIFADTKAYLARFGTTTDVPNFADAAVWFWNPTTGGTLYAFKAGTIAVQITIGGLSQEDSLRIAKQLAAKPFGGTAGTGYVYLGTPKGDAAAKAAADAAAAADATALTKLIEQGKTFSQAPYITESQFMKAVKQVSLTFETDPTLEKFISSADQRKAIETELGNHGIAVRPTAPVRLVATVAHHEFLFTKTSGGPFVAATTDQYPIHDIALTLKFIVTAGAWRNGKFYLLEAAPAYANYAIDIPEGSEFQKQVNGDDTLKSMRRAYYQIVIDAFRDIDTSNSGEKKPWTVNSWTAREKAAADADFIKTLSAQSAVSKKSLVGLDGLWLNFKLSTNNDPSNTDRCAPNSDALRDLWRRSLQRVGLVETPEEANLELRHVYDCQFTYGVTAAHYFRIIDTISVIENNVIFDLNGNWVRRPGLLLFSYNTGRKIEYDFVPPMQDYLPSSITDFLLDLVGNR
jgi:hypothetical protein